MTLTPITISVEYILGWLVSILLVTIVSSANHLYRDLWSRFEDSVIIKVTPDSLTTGAVDVCFREDEAHSIMFFHGISVKSFNVNQPSFLFSGPIQVTILRY